METIWYNIEPAANAHGTGHRTSLLVLFSWPCSVSASCRYQILYSFALPDNTHMCVISATGPRVVALSQQSVAAAVRSQQLSEQWTVGYALELLLIGGLLPEAVWLTLRLGDWTTAAALSLAYSNYCTENSLLSR